MPLFPRQPRNPRPRCRRRPPRAARRSDRTTGAISWGGQTVRRSDLAVLSLQALALRVAAASRGRRRNSGENPSPDYFLEFFDVTPLVGAIFKIGLFDQAATRAAAGRPVGPSAGQTREWARAARNNAMGGPLRVQRGRRGYSVKCSKVKSRSSGSSSAFNRL